MDAIPVWIRKFCLDFVETGLGLLLALNLVMPGDPSQAREQALIVAAALLSALISAARRAAPGAIEWLRGLLHLDPSL